MAIWNPYFTVYTSDVPSVRGFLLQPPIAWHTVAEAWNAEAGSAINGQFIRGKGEAQGSGVIKPQDTYISGTGSRTGRPFTVTTSTWKDDYINPRTHKYEMLRPDSIGSFDISSTSTTTTIEPCEIVLRRGMKPNTVTATRSNMF